MLRPGQREIIEQRFRNNFVLAPNTKIEIDDDGYVSVDGHCTYEAGGPSRFPVNFKHVSGNFDCSTNLLSSLKGAPETVGGSFTCRRTGIRSLEYCPTKIGHSFDCGRNPIESLKGCPTIVPRVFDCSEPGIQSLLHGPTRVGEHYFASETNLSDLRGCARQTGTLYLDDIPALQSLEGISEVARFVRVDYRTTLNLLPILGCQYEELSLRTTNNSWNSANIVGRIITKYHGSGIKASLAFASELVSAGYPGNAGVK